VAFLTGQLIFKVYTDSAQTDFPQELFPGITKSFSDTTVTGLESLYESLAASGSVTINLNSLSNITGVYLYSDSTDINVAINGGSAITYKASIPGYMPLVITSLTLTNSSSTTATNISLVLVKG
jgi:hypothetical protein